MTTHRAPRPAVTGTAPSQPPRPATSPVQDKPARKRHRRVRPPTPAASLPLRRFTVDEYAQLLTTGVLYERERVELLDGVMVQMAAMGSRHIACIARTQRALAAVLPESVILFTQSAVRLSLRSEPEPDLTLVRYRADFYADAKAEPADILLIIEVADTSLTRDRDVKLRLYAAAGVPEVWIAHIARATITAYRQPSGPTYRQRRVYRRGDVLTPLLLPEVVIAVNDVFGAPATAQAGGDASP